MDEPVKYEDEIDDQKDNNPWEVDDLEEFLFFCCPECPDRCPTAEAFVNHALNLHPKARNVIRFVADSSSLSNEFIIKEEDFEHYVIKDELKQGQHKTVSGLTGDDSTAADDIIEEDKDDISSENDEYEPPLKKPRDCKKMCMKKSSQAKHYRQVQCYVCSEMMPMAGVMEHIRVRHHYRRNYMRFYGEKRQFKCSSCNASLETDPKDGSHSCSLASVAVEKVEDGFKCGFCFKIFGRLGYAVRHISTVHTEERKYQCENCDYSGKSSHLLNQHMKIMHEKVRPHVCDTCGKSFYTEYQMKKHQRSNHQDVNKPKDTKSSGRGKSSKQLSTAESERIPCDLCDRIFFSLKSLNLHKSRSHEPDNSDRVGCEFCGTTFTTLSYLKQHFEKEHASKEDIDKIECRCEKCNEQFQISLALNTHLATCLDNPKNLKCDHCQEDNWHSAIALKKHIAEVHRILRDVCDICGVVLKSSYYLDLHKLKVHGFNATYIPCDKCGKVLPQDQLQRHILVVHENYRPYKCTSCDSAFATYAMLQRHTKAKHLRDTQFKCKLCNYSTFTPGAVTTHTRIVHDKAKPNKCDHCDMAFYYKRDKIKHISKHHNDLC